MAKKSRVALGLLFTGRTGKGLIRREGESTGHGIHGATGATTATRTATHREYSEKTRRGDLMKVTQWSQITRWWLHIESTHSRAR